jgi:hypothetical protein
MTLPEPIVAVGVTMHEREELGASGEQVFRHPAADPRYADGQDECVARVRFECRGIGDDGHRHVVAGKQIRVFGQKSGHPIRPRDPRPLQHFTPETPGAHDEDTTRRLRQWIVHSRGFGRVDSVPVGDGRRPLDLPGLPNQQYTVL